MFQKRAHTRQSLYRSVKHFGIDTFTCVAVWLWCLCVRRMCVCVCDSRTREIIPIKKHILKRADTENNRLKLTENVQCCNRQCFYGITTEFRMLFHTTTKTKHNDWIDQSAILLACQMAEFESGFGIYAWFSLSVRLPLNESLFIFVRILQMNVINFPFCTLSTICNRFDLKIPGFCFLRTLIWWKSFSFWWHSKCFRFELMHALKFIQLNSAEKAEFFSKIQIGCQALCISLKQIPPTKTTKANICQIHFSRESFTLRSTWFVCTIKLPYKIRKFCFC